MEVLAVASNLQLHAADAWSLLPKIFAELLPFNFREREENYLTSSFAELVFSDPITQVAQLAEVSTELPGAAGQQWHPGTQISVQHAWPRRQLIPTTLQRGPWFKSRKNLRRAGKMFIYSDLRCMFMSQDYSWALLEQRKHLLVMLLLFNDGHVWVGSLAFGKQISSKPTLFS